MLPNGWPPTGVYYANSLDGGQNWSRPLQLGGESQGWANIVASGETDVHVVWNGSPPAAGRYYRWSTYHGRVWSETELVSGSGGLTQGWPTIDVDSAGIVHVLMFANDSRGDDIHYLSREKIAWSEPIIVSHGEAGGYTGHPTSLVAYGNEVHVVWVRFRREGEPQGIWYSHLNTNSPRTATLPVPVQRLSISEEAGNVGSTSGTPDSTEPEESATTIYATQATQVINTEAGSVHNNPATSVLLGIFPVIVMIALAVFIQRVRARVR